MISSSVSAFQLIILTKKHKLKFLTTSKFNYFEHEILQNVKTAALLVWAWRTMALSWDEFKPSIGIPVPGYRPYLKLFISCESNTNCWLQRKATHIKCTGLLFIIIHKYFNSRLILHSIYHRYRLDRSLMIGWRNNS